MYCTEGTGYISDDVLVKEPVVNRVGVGQYVVHIFVLWASSRAAAGADPVEAREAGRATIGRPDALTGKDRAAPRTRPAVL